MNLDLDIAAADALTLDRIKAQEYRNELASLRDYRLKQLAAQQAQFDSLPPELTFQQRIRLALGEAIAGKYFTTNTNTTPAGWVADAAQDAGKFGAALDAAVAEVTRS